MAGVIDIRQSRPDRSQPHDEDAEQSILGALLFENSLVDLISDQLEPEMFYEPLHSRVYAKIVALAHAGRRADPITVFDALSTDTGLVQLGGARYLADLVDRAPAGRVALDYAGVLRSLWQRRSMIRIGEDMISAARSTDDPPAAIETAEKDLLAVQTCARGIELVSAESAVETVMDQYANPAKAFGVKLGLEPIDDITGGMMPGELWLIAARPGQGKSALASSAALHIALHGRGPDGEPMGVIEICSEMTTAQMMRRHIADACFEMYGREGPTYSAIRRRSLSDRQERMMREAAKRIRDLDTLKSLYRIGLTVPGIRAICRRQKGVWARRGVRLGAVIIDHVGLVRASAATRGRTEEQSEVARDAKALGAPEELDCAIVGLVQLSRKVEERDNKRPQLQDLRDSGEWEQSGDGVIGIYRDAYYAEREPAPKRHEAKLEWDERCSSPMVDALLLKVREGQVQTVKLWADMGRNAIRGEAPENSYIARANAEELFGRPGLQSAADLLNPDTPLAPAPDIDDAFLA